MLDFCACIGNQYGEPYCYCEMQRRGVPLNETARRIDELKLKTALSEVFEKHYGQEPIKNKTTG